MRNALLPLSAALLLAAPASAQKVPDTRLDVGSPPGAAASTTTDVAVEGDAVYALWSDSRDGAADIYFNRSLDRGNTWLAQDIRIDNGDAPGASDSGKPRLTALGGSVYVTWIDRRSGLGDTYFNRSLDQGATWLAQDIRLDVGSAAGTGLSDVPDVAALGDSVYVSWEDGRDGDLDIYINVSHDRGATWLAQDVRLDTGDPAGSGHSVDPYVAVTTSGVFVCWEDWRFAGVAAMFNRSLDSGATWLPVCTRLDTGPLEQGDSFDPHLTASGSNVYVAWYDNRNDYFGPFKNEDIYFNRSLDAGTTWLASDVRIDSGDAPGNSASVKPDLASDGLNVYVVWADSLNDADGVPPYQQDVYFDRSTDGGLTWMANDTRLDVGSAPGAAHTGTVVMERSGAKLYVSYTDKRSGENDVYLNRSVDAGLSWLAADVRLDTGDPPGASKSFFPRLGASDSGVHLVWWDFRDGLADIYYNTPFANVPYGAGKAGSGGIVPSLAVATVPAATLGASASIDVSGGVGGGIGGVFLGTQVGAIPLFEGTLLVDGMLGSGLEFVVPLGGAAGAPGAGSGSKPFTIPSNPALVGRLFCFQVLVLDLGVAPSPVSMTNGVQLWIG